MACTGWEASQKLHLDLDLDTLFLEDVESKKEREKKARNEEKKKKEKRKKQGGEEEEEERGVEFGR
jgi:hypothetical protein